MSAKAPDATTVPGMPAPAYGDTIGAMTIAGGISAALFHRERTGEADVVDVSLMNTGHVGDGRRHRGVAARGHAVARARRAHRRRRSPTRSCRYYETKDGRFLSFWMLQGFHYWPEACERFGIPQYIDDPRFDTNELLHGERAGRRRAGRRGDQEEDARGVEGAAAGDEGPVGAGAGHDRGADDPQTVANGYLQEIHSKDGTRSRW